MSGFASPTERDVAQALGRFWRRNGYPPTQEELAKESGYSPATAFNMLSVLEARGLVVRFPGHRSAMLTADHQRLLEVLAETPWHEAVPA